MKTKSEFQLSPDSIVLSLISSICASQKTLRTINNLKEAPLMMCTSVGSEDGGGASEEGGRLRRMEVSEGGGTTEVEAEGEGGLGGVGGGWKSEEEGCMRGVREV